MSGGRSAILALKNTDKILVFAPIVPIRGTLIAASGKIDGNGSLPITSRNLTALHRSDRGGSIWAGKWP